MAHGNLDGSKSLDPLRMTVVELVILAGHLGVEPSELLGGLVDDRSGIDA